MGRSWRGWLRQYAPGRVRELVSSVQLRAVRDRNQQRQVAEVFSEIYSSQVWGHGETFDSGSGSRGRAADGYVAYVQQLLRDEGIRTLVDIGCGDFRVAAQFAHQLDHYHGVDVVPELITRNQAEFGGETVTFSVRDAAVDELPPADVCLIRQVLQHLSNDQILAILRSCRRYPLVVITESWPAPTAMRRANLDKPHGPDTRLDRGSWVELTAAPFECSPLEEVLQLPSESPMFRDGETIRTHIWRPTSLG